MKDIIKRAIEVFHREETTLPGPGAIIAHVSDPCASEVRSVEHGVVTGFYVDGEGQEHVAQFPVDEVFNPGSVSRIAQRLVIAGDSPDICVDGGLCDL